MSVATGSDLYAAEFERVERRLDGAPAWLAAMHRAGFQTFRQHGFPTPKDEEWRFTNIAPLSSRAFRLRPDAAPDVAAELVAAHRVPGVRLVFVDGRFSPEHSRLDGLPPGAEVTPLTAASGETRALVEAHLGRVAPVADYGLLGLNAAFFEDVACVRLEPKIVVERPIQLLYLSGASGADVMAHPRTLVLAGAQSQATIVETYASAGEDAHFTNAVTEVVLGPAAILDHYKVLRENVRSFHMAAMHLLVDRDVRASSHSLTLGGGLVRNDAVAVLNGEGADCTLNGLYLSDRDRLIDNHTTIDHAKPHCGSHEVYKGILDGRGRAVFNGKIVVRQDAQKTDAKQTNKALLLSEHAQINTKPQLEIFADDVKCTHGATVGQLDPDALFYLRARGIGLDTARAMLIRAFAGDILDRVRIPELRTALEAELLRQLPGRSTLE